MNQYWNKNNPFTQAVVPLISYKKFKPKATIRSGLEKITNATERR